MHYLLPMKSYLEQLSDAANDAGIELLQAFKDAGIPTSTFYRAKTRTDLHLATAEKVYNAIRVYALQRTATNI
jgi:predicted transcriptional regulator